MQAENRAIKERIVKNYGWHLLAKDVADFANCSYLVVMELSALEVAGFVSLIQARAELIKMSTPQPKR